MLLSLQSAFIADNLCLNYLDDNHVSQSAHDNMLAGLRALSN